MDKIYRFRTREIFKCASCNEQFSAKVGTIFEKSKIELNKWMLTIYLNSANKKGISSHQLAKEISVSQKTAWFMLHRIRKVVQPTHNDKLDGVVMSDETFVGGRNKNRHKDKKVKNSQGRSFIDKTPVIGLKQQNGEIRCFVIADTTKENIHPVINEHVKEGSVFVSDEWKGYYGLSEKYNHQVVEHRFGLYKSKDGYSTNSVEGFWGLFKRIIIGIYHYVSPKHMQRYVDEIAFKYNTRSLNSGERFLFIMSKIKTRLTYKQLVYGT
jgi:transposase-like protein